MDRKQDRHKGGPKADARSRKFIPNHHHQAQCEPTLALMESIAATIPEAIQEARREAWKAGALHILLRLETVRMLGPEDFPMFLDVNPYGPAEVRAA